MSEYALRIGHDEGQGPYTEAELHLRLEEYREQNPDDPLFSRVLIWEMHSGGSAGAPCSVFDFIEPR
jgi:hypothetical protein